MKKVIFFNASDHDARNSYHILVDTDTITSDEQTKWQLYAPDFFLGA